MYKLLFVDEEKDVFDDFLDYVDLSPLKTQFEIITEYPSPTLDEMILTIIKLNPDAVVTDFMLNDQKVDIKYNVPYNGSTLVKEFTAVREGFPCFILTSFDDSAVNQSTDVNIVYIKNILHKDVEAKTKARATFLERVKSQIDHYRSRIDTSEKRLLQLIEIRKSGKANIEDEEEMIRLDSFLESTVDRKNVIPGDFKSLSNINKLESILSKVDELLNKIEKRNEE
ncbi:hypothetical protein SAMN05421820_104185 [Pedobacter steynii]|uniref:Response regulatory domain-containing protein n=1 Tax=Pedobacter steynii TaxID=430522 RepID=A0A1G9UJ02_9SPHI|nr:hypothetical protein [Pedobacter steynii]NQX40780.1 hypothetical protein [Pedobacter steynii]SDM59813.1 hypothetical protein SAMN05421820_104185 [Pedobacter steynii]